MTEERSRSPAKAHRPQNASFVSRRMAAVRSRQNAAEFLLRKALHGRGFRYRLYGKSLPGRPDLVFPKHKAVVFVDGDFWHGRVLRERGPAALEESLRTEHRDYWITKLHRNVARDDYVSRALTDRGWKVLRVWESEVKKDVNAVAERIATALTAPC